MAQLTLRAVLGPYPHALPLKDGRVTSSRIRLEFEEFPVVNRTFRPMVNELTWDVCEMALVTLMLGRAFERPLIGLPVVMMRQSAHRMLHCRAGSGLRDPADLAGMTLGVRAYTQTTGTWLRGILQDQYGVDLSRLTWVTFEDAHVNGYVDPPSCSRAGSGRTLLEMVLDGSVDASVGLEPAEGIRTVIADVPAAEAAFGLTPVNHVVAVRSALVAEHPWLAAELFRMFCEARALEPAIAAEYGLEPNRPAVSRLALYAHEQGITPREMSPDELFLPI